MAEQQSLSDLKMNHPMPWNYFVVPGSGLIIVHDATGKEVPLLTLLEFTRFITGKIA